MFLVIDNYDSFVYNLARYFECAGEDVRVVRNDAITLDVIAGIDVSGMILSPGPCTPSDAGISTAVVRAFGAKIPILGVCLGHQAIGEAYGARTVRGPEPLHGQATSLTHNGQGLFEGMPNPMEAGRYHSLIIEMPEDCPLEVTARTDDETGEIMAVAHPVHPVYGVQFHPESILTPQGMALIENFIKLAKGWRESEGKAA